MFQIKICGITRIQDALSAVAAGADAIGLNFFEGSKRFISAENARKISEQIRESESKQAFDLPTRKVMRVGVFVNHTPDEILATTNSVGLDAVQLHGDEPSDFVERLQAMRVIRAVRFRGEEDPAWVQATEEARAGQLAGILIDAFHPDVYGGSGKVVDWQRVAKLQEIVKGTPLILAGGLTPSNVAQAVAESGLRAVDVASGVEVVPGIKDEELIKQFVERVRVGLKQVE